MSFAGVSKADLWQVQANTGNGLVNATAQFTLGAGTLQILLTNLQQDPKSVGQLISGVSFVVSGATGAASIVSASGLVTKIGDKGSYKPGVATNPLEHWGVEGSTTLTTLTGGKPNQLIIGPDNKGGFDPTKGAYKNANSSIAQHNPVVLGTGTFLLSIAGVTSSSIISNVKIEFGSGPVSVAAERVNAVPEPSTMVIASLGAVAFLGYGLRQRKRAA